jgi:hypothetical protein
MQVIRTIVVAIMIALVWSLPILAVSGSFI